jgi:hypothetical protein
MGTYFSIFLGVPLTSSNYKPRQSCLSFIHIECRLGIRTLRPSSPVEPATKTSLEWRRCVHSFFGFSPAKYMYKYIYVWVVRLGRRVLDMHTVHNLLYSKMQRPCNWPLAVACEILDTIDTIEEISPCSVHCPHLYSWSILYVAWVRMITVIDFNPSCWSSCPSQNPHFKRLWLVQKTGHLIANLQASDCRLAELEW